MYSLIMEGVADANGNMPVWIGTTVSSTWTQVGTSAVWKSTLSANTSLDNVIEHTNSDVNGDLTPGAGNQQTLIERSLPSDLQEGEMTYQFSSDEFENDLDGMSSDAAFAQVPNAPANTGWTGVNTSNTYDFGDSQPGYLDFGSTGAGSAANSVFWASTWVWVPPQCSTWTWQNPMTFTEPTGNYTYGPFRASRNPSEDSSNQYNKDRIWVNGQMVPAAIFSTGTDNTSLEPHSYPWYGDNEWGSDTAADEIEYMNLQQGWNHLVFQFDTSSTASGTTGNYNKFRNDELAFKFGLNSAFFNGGTGLISQATVPADLSQAPTTGTPEPYISQYSVLSTSMASIATPFTSANGYSTSFDPAVYVRLRNGEAATAASVVIQTIGGNLPSGAFFQLRGLDCLAQEVGSHPGRLAGGLHRPGRLRHEWLLGRAELSRGHQRYSRSGKGRAQRAAPGAQQRDQRLHAGFLSYGVDE